MTTIIHRSALVYHGHDPAPEVHSIVIDWDGKRRVVTWGDVMRERRAHQAAILERRRHVEPRRAVRLWVAYFDQDLMGGWHAFLDDFRGRKGRTWINRYRNSRFDPELMGLFPLSLPLGSDDRERFEVWMVAFARAYQRGTQCGQPRGCAFLWQQGHKLMPLAGQESTGSGSESVK